MENIRIVLKENVTTITIKGSKFVSYIYNTSTKEEIDSIISALRKEHYKATHICYAYNLGKDKSIEFFTDAGEPSGTAGKPIMGVIQKNKLNDTLIVVVRYFGGTKLGIRGLIEAYRKSAEEIVKASKIITKSKFEKIEIAIKYTHLSTVEYQVRNRNGLWISPEYKNENIKVIIAFPTNSFEQNKDWLIDKKGAGLINDIKFLGQDWFVVNLK